MLLCHQQSSLMRSTCVQGSDLRQLSSNVPSNHPRVARQPVSSVLYANVTASTSVRLFSRQIPGPLIQQPRACKRSGCTAQKTVHAFQSDAPVEQQIDPPPPSPKFQPFTPQTGVRQDMLNYRHQVEVAGGSILVRPLTQAWVDECGALLTGAFADAMGYVPMYRTYLRHQIRQYLHRHADMPPKAIVLVALLIPEQASRDETSTADDDSASGPNAEPSTSGQNQEEQNARLVGTVELSFAASTRARYLTLNAPVNCAYLCNMAVDANYRRRGYGNILLDAADDMAKIAGEKEIFLHLRFQDAAPASLYKQAGYVSDKADTFLVRLLGLDRRYLMKKQHR
ncbi:hypothetical protein ABBQ38_014020 [Trebouxia sp. C0009 RCD-2024]